MTQMAPLNWLSLYTYFSMLFLLIMILSYYSFLNNTMNMDNKKINTLYIWKW